MVEFGSCVAPASILDELSISGGKAWTSRHGDIMSYVLSSHTSEWLHRGSRVQQYLQHSIVYLEHCLVAASRADGIVCAILEPDRSSGFPPDQELSPARSSAPRVSVWSTELEMVFGGAPGYDLEI